MKNKGFLTTVKGKITLFIGITVLGIGAVIGTALVLSTEKDNILVRSDEEAYGDTFELENMGARPQDSSSLNKQKVTLVLEDGYQEAEEGTNEDLEKWRDEQINKVLSDNGLTAYDLVNYGDKVEASVMQQIEEIMKEYEESVNSVDPLTIRGKDGSDGKDGKDGIQGATGLRGATGPAGSPGKTGQTGPAGQTGNQGIPGEQGAPGQRGQDGLNGKSTYIAYAESADGKTGFSKTPTNRSRYIGTCITDAAAAPSDPKSYSWQEYKDYIITFDESTNTLMITN